jgi:uncharacterized membrane protein YhhN
MKRGQNLKINSMKKNWLIFFAVAMGADLVGVYLKNETLVYAAKPIVVLALVAYFVSTTAGIKTGLKKLIIAALFFSWLGDVLLMFESFNKNYFLFGLTAFLIAHLFYIFFFSKIKNEEKIDLKGSIIVLVAVYYTGLILLLYAHLGEMKIPVIVYGLIISIMLMLALHMLYIKNKKAGKLMMNGALLFVTSDSILAINKFLQPFEFAGIFTMLTYGLAQLLITLGAVQYLSYTSKQ